MSYQPIKLPQVEYAERGLYEIWETMLAKAMSVSDKEIKNYVKTTEDN